MEWAFVKLYSTVRVLSRHLRICIRGGLCIEISSQVGSLWFQCMVIAFVMLSFFEAKSPHVSHHQIENVMVNEKGYCVVVDMGFAKVVLDKTYTMCG